MKKGGLIGGYSDSRLAVSLFLGSLAFLVLVACSESTAPTAISVPLDAPANLVPAREPLATLAPISEPDASSKTQLVPTADNNPTLSVPTLNLNRLRKLPPRSLIQPGQRLPNQY